MPASLVFVLAVTTALLVSFLCSIAESVLLSVRPAQVEALIRGGSRAGRILRRFKRDIDKPIAAILILNTVAHTAGTAVAGSSYNDTFPGSPVWIFSVVFTVAVLVFTEIIPKTLGVTFANRLAVLVTLGVRALITVLRPIIWVTSWLSSLLMRRAEKRPVTSIEEIRLLAALGRAEGVVGPRMAQLIEGAASLRELSVHDVMVPRGGVAYLSGSHSLKENLETIRASGHSRFPFTPTNDLDDVSGVVLVKELLFRIQQAPDQPIDWTELVTPLLVVPESKPLDQALRLFQERRKHMAVVVDEYGGTQGVVTLEDVLEEIVGEIEDETDRVEQLIVKRPDGSLVCRGRAETRKLFKVLGLDQKVDFVTLGGLVADLLGRVPVEDDVVEWEGIRFRVLVASARRAERIEVTPPK